VSLSIQFEDEGIPGFLLRERAPVEQREERPCNSGIAASLVAVWSRASRLTLLFFGIRDDESDDEMRNGMDTVEQRTAADRQERRNISQPAIQGTSQPGHGVLELHKAMDAFRVVEGERAMHNLLIALAEQSADRLRAHGFHVQDTDITALRGKLQNASAAANHWKNEHDKLAAPRSRQGSEDEMEEVS
jgi:hypothetical protein